MATVQPPIIGDSFAVGFRFQHYWDASMANAFFFGELGAGIFFISFLYNVMWGMILGLAVTGILKTYAHMAHMGVPAKSWRAILRPDRAWVSRGLITIGFFTAFGVLHLLNVYNGVFGVLPADGALATIIKVLAAISALGVVAYHGLAISDSPAISLWRIWLMPLVGIGYAMVAGAAVTAVLGGASLTAGNWEALPEVGTLTLWLLEAEAILILAALYSASHGAPGARVSANLLLKGEFAKQFVTLVLVVGLLVPLLLLLLAPPGFWVTLLVAVTFLAGYRTFRVFLFKAGVYDPIMSFAPKDEDS